VLGVLEAEVLPGAPAVFALVDAVAVGDRTLRVAFSRPDPDDVRILRIDRNGGRIPPEWWTNSTGTGGRIPSERVDGIGRNTQAAERALRLRQREWGMRVDIKSAREIDTSTDSGGAEFDRSVDELVRPCRTEVRGSINVRS
jgi:hypothetical protein